MSDEKDLKAIISRGGLTSYLNSLSHKAMTDYYLKSSIGRCLNGAPSMGDMSEVQPCFPVQRNHVND